MDVQLGKVDWKSILQKVAQAAIAALIAGLLQPPPAPTVGE